MIETRSIIAIEKELYIVFPWADGGNLWNLWERNSSYECRSQIARQNVSQIVDQLVGMTDALRKLHKLNNGSYRHGDLKPENVLIFDTKSHKPLGTWKLADFGLAKYHAEATGRRVNPTSHAGSGTISYQPPEGLRTPKGKKQISRLYDIWSMGCILLQLMTWLIYGREKIDQLTSETENPLANHESSYWTASWSTEAGYSNIGVHPAIDEHIRSMRDDLKSSKPLLALLSVVRDKLLVIKLPSDSEVVEQGCRTNADDLYGSLRKIQAAGKGNPVYWLSVVGNVVKQASTLQLPQGRNPGIATGNNVSSNSSLDSLLQTNRDNRTVFVEILQEWDIDIFRA